MTFIFQALSGTGGGISVMALCPIWEVIGMTFHSGRWIWMRPSPSRPAGLLHMLRYEGSGCCVLFFGRGFFLQIFECSGEFFEAFLLFLKALHEVLQFRGAGLERSQTG